MLYIGTVVLWLAAVSRIVSSVKRPDPARISMTVAAVCIAFAFTLSASIAGIGFDDLLGKPNASELVSHLFFTVAVFATLRFLHLLRRGSLPRRWTVFQVTLCVLVCVTMVVMFTAVPLQDYTANNFAAEYAGDLAAVLYRAVFYTYLVYCLVGITIICRRNLVRTAGNEGAAAHHEVAATAVSLSAIAAGAALATLASIAGMTGMIIRYLTGEVAGPLVLFNLVAVALAAVFAGFGVLAPVPVEAVLRWRRARQTSERLSPLWTGLTNAVPDVVLPIPSTRSPVARAELASTRQRIEIADALHRVRINRQDAVAISRSDDPSAALGRTLRNCDAWAVTGSGGVIAAELLTEPKDSDLHQILTVAAAYGPT